jgi:hypothetical protein
MARSSVLESIRRRHVVIWRIASISASKPWRKSTNTMRFTFYTCTIVPKFTDYGVSALIGDAARLRDRPPWLVSFATAPLDPPHPPCRQLRPKGFGNAR